MSFFGCLSGSLPRIGGVFGGNGKNDHGCLPLHLACCCCPPLDIVHGFLNACPEGAVVCSNEGWLLLHVACCMGASVEDGTSSIPCSFKKPQPPSFKMVRPTARSSASRRCRLQATVARCSECGKKVTTPCIRLFFGHNIRNQ